MLKGEQQYVSWWQRNQDPSLEEDTLPPPEKRLLYAVLERAVSDLDLNTYIEQEDRRDAIKWFKGISFDKTGLTFEFISEELHLKPKVLKEIAERVRFAEKFPYGVVKVESNSCTSVLTQVPQMAV